MSKQKDDTGTGADPRTQPQQALAGNAVHKQAQEALRESEERWRSITEYSPDHVMLLDRDGIIQFANRAMPGLSREQSIGTSVYETIPETYREPARECFERVLASGQPGRFEHVYRHPDGRLQCLETHVGPVLRDGTVVALAASSRDVTERVRAEQASRESERRYRTLFDRVPAGLYRITPGGQFVDANPALVRMLGYPDRESLRATLATDLYLDPTSLTESLALADRPEGVRGFQIQLRRRDGETIWAQIDSRAIRGDQGLVLYYEGAMEDITERVQTEQALRRSLEETDRSRRLLLALSDAAQAIQRAHTPEEIYRIVGDHVMGLGYDAAIYTLSEDRTHLVLAHLTFKPDLVHESEKLDDIAVQGYHFRLTPGGFYQRIIDEGQTVYHVGDADSIVGALTGPIHPLAAPSGGLFDREQCITAPLRVGGVIYGLLSVGGSGLREVDVPAITAFADQAAIAIENALLFQEVNAGRKRLQDLATYLENSREAERTRIARELHDEFGQALTALKMDVAWLSRRLPPEEPLWAEKVEAITALIDDTIQMVRQVVTELRPDVLDNLGLAAALEWQAQEFTERTGIACELEVSDEEMALDGDHATALFRIFQETLTNVVRHAEATRVRVVLREEGEAVVLIVQDDGKGIGKRQVSASQSLGLIGMRERAQTHGGTIAFQADAGTGTTVTVRMPRMGREERGR